MYELRDYVKVRRNGERFWLEIVEIKYTITDDEVMIEEKEIIDLYED
jgi:hypothetical protein